MAIKIGAGQYKCARHGFGVIVTRDLSDGVSLPTITETYEAVVSLQRICERMDATVCDPNCQLKRLEEDVLKLKVGSVASPQSSL